MEQNKKSENKSSNKGLKIFLLVFILILIILLVVFFSIRFLENKSNTGKDIINDIDEELINISTASGNLSDMNNVIITSEGIKVNVSEKMLEERRYDNFIVTNVNLSSQSGNSVITVTLKNDSKKKVENKEFTLILLNSQGKKIGETTGIIDSLEADMQTIVYINADSDLSNAYNYKIKF